MRFNKQIINIPIYQCSIVFGGYKQLGFDEDIKTDFGTKRASCRMIDGDVWFYYSDSIGGSILAHEVVHMANMIFTMKGIQANETNDEHLAYLVEYIYKQLSEKIFNTKERYKK